jgi:hypothetical protein
MSKRNRYGEAVLDMATVKRFVQLLDQLSRTQIELARINDQFPDIKETAKSMVESDIAGHEYKIHRLRDLLGVLL